MNTDEVFMQRAVDLALRAQGRTSPNPVVGAVIVRDGRVLGEGYHRQAGRPHAESRSAAQSDPPGPWGHRLRQPGTVLALRQNAPLCTKR